MNSGFISLPVKLTCVFVHVCNMYPSLTGVVCMLYLRFYTVFSSLHIPIYVNKMDAIKIIMVNNNVAFWQKINVHGHKLLIFSIWESKLWHWFAANRGYVILVGNEHHLNDIWHTEVVFLLTKMLEVECTTLKEEPVSYKCFCWLLLPQDVLVCSTCA